jgi:sulfatase modifying factor 1
MRRRAVLVCVTIAASACSLFVDTGGLDTQTDATDGTVDAPFDAPNDVRADATDATDATADGPTTDDAGCPNGGGPSMVHLPWGCIDSTEVTHGQYKQFVTATQQGYTPPTPPRCGWNTGYLLSTASYCIGQPDDFPVNCINWCKAYAFCQWAGKHLCGGLDGGALSFDVDEAGATSNRQDVDPNFSAWELACTNSATTTFPYGNTFQPVCNTPPPNDAGGPDAVAVGSLPQCQGPAGVFDLAGNASEWLDACNQAAGNGASDRCAHLGGASSSYLSCGSHDDDTRSSEVFTGYPLGFRCCAP